MKRIAALLLSAAAILHAETPLRLRGNAERMDVRDPADALLGRDLVFTGGVKPYSTEAESKGLRFIGPGDFEATGAWRPADASGSPIVGLEQGARLLFNGHLAGNGGNSRVSLDLRDGAHFILGAAARTSFMNSAFFTRQLWIHGDGSGVFEIADGFVADHTQGGTVEEGIGSFRLSHMILRTHATAGLPGSPRHFAPLEGPNLNAHLVFENQGPCVWQTRSHPQTYSGGLWIGVDTVFETGTSLTHDGVAARWQDYTNPGAFQTTAENITLRKRGDADLILAGEQGYLPGTRFVVEDGRLVFRTDAKGGTLRAKAGVGGQELMLDIAEKGVVSVETPALHLAALSVRGELRMEMGHTIRIGGLLERGGTLRLTGDGFPAPGQILRVFEAGESKGTWTKVEMPDPPPGRRWDLRALETDGSIRLD